MPLTLRGLCSGLTWMCPPKLFSCDVSLAVILVLRVILPGLFRKKLGVGRLCEIFQLFARPVLGAGGQRQQRHLFVVRHLSATTPERSCPAPSSTGSRSSRWPAS